MTGRVRQVVMRVDRPSNVVAQGWTIFATIRNREDVLPAVAKARPDPLEDFGIEALSGRHPPRAVPKIWLATTDGCSFSMAESVVVTQVKSLLLL